MSVRMVAAIQRAKSVTRMDMGDKVVGNRSGRTQFLISGSTFIGEIREVHVADDYLLLGDPSGADVYIKISSIDAVTVIWNDEVKDEKMVTEWQ